MQKLLHSLSFFKFHTWNVPPLHMLEFNKMVHISQIFCSFEHMFKLPIETQICFDK